MTASRRVHDVGGLPAGPVDASDHEDLRWHKEFTATFYALIAPRRRTMRLDELRRAVEDLGEEAYNRLGYFERQLHATASVLVERGLLSWDEIDGRVAEFRDRDAGKEINAETS